MKDYSHAVFIARMQPPHLAHIQVIERALDKAERVIIVLGSHRTSPDIRNPWTAKQRSEMVMRCFKYEDSARMHFVAVRDQPYNDTYWMADVHEQVSEIVRGKSNPRVILVGHKKDRTSFYLEFFPQWNFEDLGFMHKYINATDIREQYFGEGSKPKGGWTDKHWHDAVHEGVKDYLEKFRDTEDFGKLYAQWDHVKKYKEQWASAPFPPTFVTADAVVVKSGHVLLVRRGRNPGKDMLALPGGFIDEDRTLLDCAIRELMEETQIEITGRSLRDQQILRDSVVGSRVFDHPDRSLRGRTITHAYHIKLPDEGFLPKVKGSDDAAQALWMPIGDLHFHEEEFFEDHLDIIENFINR